MAVVFQDDFESYTVGDNVPSYPSTLGGLWSKWGFFGGQVTSDDSYLPGGKSLKFQTTGTIRWQDNLNFWNQGTVIYAFKTSTAANALNASGFMDFYDTDIPLSIPFPTPVLLFRLRWAADSTLTAQIGHLEEFVNNSGYAHNANTPLGIITTEPFAAEPDTWYILQINFEFSQTMLGALHVSFVVHINDKPVLCGDATSLFSTTGNYPHGFPPTFNQIELVTSQNPFAFLDLVSFDSDKTIDAGGGVVSYGRASQAVLEPITLPASEDLFARISQAVIEIKSLPDNYARVTQAIIELLTVNGGVVISGGWKVGEA